MIIQVLKIFLRAPLAKGKFWGHLMVITLRLDFLLLGMVYFCGFCQCSWFIIEKAILFKLEVILNVVRFSGIVSRHLSWSEDVNEELESIDWVLTNILLTDIWIDNTSPILGGFYVVGKFGEVLQRVELIVNDLAYTWPLVGGVDPLTGLSAQIIRAEFSGLVEIGAGPPEWEGDIGRMSGKRSREGLGASVSGPLVYLSAVSPSPSEEGMRSFIVSKISGTLISAASPPLSSTGGGGMSRVVDCNKIGHGVGLVLLVMVGDAASASGNAFGVPWQGGGGEYVGLEAGRLFESYAFGGSTAALFGFEITAGSVPRPWGAGAPAMIGHVSAVVRLLTLATMMLRDMEQEGSGRTMSVLELLRGRGDLCSGTTRLASLAPNRLTAVGALCGCREGRGGSPGLLVSLGPDNPAPHLAGTLFSPSAGSGSFPGPEGVGIVHLAVHVVEIVWILTSLVWCLLEMGSAGESATLGPLDVVLCVVARFSRVMAPKPGARYDVILINNVQDYLAACRSLARQPTYCGWVTPPLPPLNCNHD